MFIQQWQQLLWDLRFSLVVSFLQWSVLIFHNLGSTLCNLSSDSIIKYSFLSYSLLHTVTFCVAYLHSIHKLLNYYFLIVSIVIRLWTGQPRNEQMQDILLFSRQSSCDAHPTTCSVGTRAQSGWRLKLTTSVQ
jgi:hypothetical protein